MSNFFRDSFTKDDAKENLLGYDDAAFRYFAVTIALLVALPWTTTFVKWLVCSRQAAAEKAYPSKSDAGVPFRYCKTEAAVARVARAREAAARWPTRELLRATAQLLALAMLWDGILSMTVQLWDAGHEITRFDPFSLLGVSTDASESEVRRAYRRLSLQYHPDKNRDDPLAASRFIQITKAHRALTDPLARRNWEAFGNPDGPQIAKVGIGLPRALLRKENGLLVLSIGLFIVVVFVPVIFIWHFSHSLQRADNGVLLETLQFFGCCTLETTRLCHFPELLAGSAESRLQRLRVNDVERLQLLRALTEPRPSHFTLPTMVRNHVLILAHMKRLHTHLHADFAQDLEELLAVSMSLTQVLIEVATMREWFTTVQAALAFRRCLVQALDAESSELLQVPHFAAEQLRLCQAQMPAVKTLNGLRALSGSERRALLCGSWPPDRADQRLLDVEAFLAHVARPCLRASLGVAGEDELVVSDVATLAVTLERRELVEGEAAGPVHAPHFPEAKFEEWLLFLVDDSPEPRIVAYDWLRSSDRVVTQELRFQLIASGSQRLFLHAMSDSYAGVDQALELKFDVLAHDKVIREYHVHPLDAELDQQKTLFQRVIGEFHRDDESDDEIETTSSLPGDKVGQHTHHRSAGTRADCDHASSSSPDASDAGSNSEGDS